MVCLAGNMMNIQSQKDNIISLAKNYFNEGYYCSEAVVRAFEDIAGLTFSDDFKRSMTILGEGIGDSGCICGAVSASILIAGYFSGRLNNNESREYAQKVGKQFIEEFKKRYQTTCCKGLKKKAEILFGIGKYRHCPEITGFCAELIYEIAIKEGWIKE